MGLGEKETAELICSVDGGGWNALRCAAARGHTQVLQLLLTYLDSDRAVGEIRQANRRGRNMLHEVGLNGRVAVAQFL